MKPLPFLHGDHVRYVGNKTFKEDDGKMLSLSGKVGEVVCKVQNEDAYIVEFSGGSFICRPDSLARQSFNANSDDAYMKHVERKWKTSDERKSKKDKK